MQASFALLVAATAATLVTSSIALGKQTTLIADLEELQRNLTKEMELRRNLTEELEIQRLSLLQDLQTQQIKSETLENVTNDTPVVLIEWLGATVGNLEHARLFTYNRKTGAGSFAGEKLHGLGRYASGTTAFWWCTMERHGANVVQRGSLLRYLIQQGTGPSHQGPPDFFQDPPYSTCKTAITLETTPNTYVYISRDGLAADRSNSTTFYKTAFNGTAVLYLDTDDVQLAISASYVEQVAAGFGVTLSGQTDAVAVDIGFTIEGLVGPLSLDHGDGTPYDADFTPSC